MATSYGVSQLGILNALMSGKTKSDIYDKVKEKKEKLFDKGVKASQIEKMDKLFDERFDRDWETSIKIKQNQTSVK